MNDTLLVGVLHPLADLDEQREPLASGELVGVAVLGERNAADQLHHEVGPSGLGRTGVERLGDAGMIHHGERLTLSREPGHHLLGVHPQLDDLERDETGQRLGLFRLVDHSHSALPQYPPDPVRSDAGRVLGRIGVRGRCGHRIFLAVGQIDWRRGERDPGFVRS